MELSLGGSSVVGGSLGRGRAGAVQSATAESCWEGSSLGFTSPGPSMNCGPLGDPTMIHHDSPLSTMGGGGRSSLRDGLDKGSDGAEGIRDGAAASEGGSAVTRCPAAGGGGNGGGIGGEGGGTPLSRRCGAMEEAAGVNAGVEDPTLVALNGVTQGVTAGSEPWAWYGGA